MTTTGTADDPYAALKTIIHPAANGRHSATVLLLHGLGDRGENYEQAIRYMLGRDLGQHQPQMRHVRFLFPTAPKQAFTLFGGRMANIWSDIQGTIANIAIPEMRNGLQLSDRLLGALIDAEIAAGVPIGRIAVVGFSLGGIMALHTGFRLRPGMAGVVSISTYLQYDNLVYDRLRAADADTIAALPPLLMLHGTEDQLLTYADGRNTHAVLRDFGVRVEFRTFVGMRHEMRGNMLLEVESWLAKRLPPLPGDLVHKL